MANLALHSFVPTYAVNNEQIAKALKLKPTRKVLAEIGAWRQRPDFPRRERPGYRIAEVQAWHQNFIKETAPLFSAGLLTEQKKAAVLQQWAQNKLRDEHKLTQFERQVLVENGILKEDAAANPGQAGEPIRNVTTQAELCVMLARHFHGRFKGDLSEQLLSDWKLGKRLRAGVPLPPAKERAYFIGAKWVEWMEAHILTDPRYRLGADAQGELDVHDRAYHSKSMQVLMDEELKRLELDKAKGRYVPLEQARNTRRGALRLQLGLFQRRNEQANTQARAEWLSSRLSAPDLLAFREYDLKLAQALTDLIYEEHAKLAALDPEKELARELAEECKL